MKLRADLPDVQVITGYGPGWLAVDKTEYRSSLLLDSQGLLQPWDCAGVEALQPEHFQHLASLAREREAELVIFGSGAKLRFMHPSWLAPLMQQRTGLETMDTHAACRTFNVLAMEGRKVLAALLLA